MNKLIFKSNKRVFLICSIIFIFLASCRLEVPIKEMSQAKANITRAVEVKAEKYAPELLKKAKDALIKSHDSMKTDDVKAAKTSAEESLKYSNEAIAVSLPLLADDTLKEARKTYEEANAAYAEKYAAEEYALAGAKIGESESLFANKEYWESYQKSVEAIAHAAGARDKALLNIAALREMMKKISDETKKLELMGVRDFAPEEMKAVDNNLAEGALLLEKKDVKNASIKIADADSALKQASQKTWKGFAASRIKAAEDAMKKIETSPAKTAYSSDIAKAGAAIKESKELFEKEAFGDSCVKSDEALTILNTIAIEMEEKLEVKRIEDVSKAGKSSPEVSEYIVKYNPKNRDCLWRIAMYTYKDARLWPLIYMANKDQIKDPDLIFPGQKFVIPPIPKKADEKSKTEIKTEENPSDKAEGKAPETEKSKEKEDINKAIEEAHDNVIKDLNESGSKIKDDNTEDEDIVLPQGNE